MKNTIFALIATFFLSVAVSAQSTADSIKAKYQLQPMPEALTIEKSFPVIGTYTMTSADGTAQNVIITLDQENKGVVWIEGLPEGKIKGYLKKSPGTYRIIAQKSESGKSVPEGTLNFDPATNTLNVALGKKFDDADPTAIFNMNGSVDADVATTTGTNTVKTKTKTANSKTKTKVVFYTATKADAQNTSVVVPQQ
jgi:hypothetical protein